MPSSEIREIRRTLDRWLGVWDRLREDLEETEELIRLKRQQARRTERAQVILRTVAKLTQEELQFQMNDLVTAALHSVFEDGAYEFQLEFVERRGRTEADLWFARNGDRLSPIEAAGGGAVDVAAFALRVAMWCLSSPRTRDTLILDEPFRFLSEGLLPRASMLLRELSKRLGIQFVMVSHAELLIEEADRVFQVSSHKGCSGVKRKDT